MARSVWAAKEGVRVPICRVDLLSDGKAACAADGFTAVRPADSGINSPWFGTLDSGASGYLKNCANTDPAMEEGEVWLAYFGQCLGMHMAETCLVRNAEGARLGCFSVDAAAGGQYLTAEQCKNQLFSAPDFAPFWARDVVPVYGIPSKLEPSPGYVFTFVQEVPALEKVLAFVYGVLSLNGQYDVQKGFVDMVLFDCLIGQKDRNMKGFGLQRDDAGKVRMAALYDNATIAMPGVPDHLIGFCNVLCEKDTMARAVSRLWPVQSLAFTDRVREIWMRRGDALVESISRFLPKAYGLCMAAHITRWHRVLSVVENEAAAYITKI